MLTEILFGRTGNGGRARFSGFTPVITQTGARGYNVLPPAGVWVIDATVSRDMVYIPFCAPLVDDAGDDDSDDGDEDERTNDGHDEDPRRGAADSWQP